jgi:CBS domain-containing protein
LIKNALPRPEYLFDIDLIQKLAELPMRARQKHASGLPVVDAAGELVGVVSEAI